MEKEKDRKKYYYSVTLLTMTSMLLGASVILVHYCYPIPVYSLLLFYVVVLSILVCFYVYIRMYSSKESWSDIVIVTGVLIPMAIGGFVSIVLSGSF